MPGALKIAVAIATAGRRDMLSETLRELSRQTRPPDRVAVCPAAPADVDAEVLTALPLKVDVVSGPVGLTSQRNALLRALDDVDVVLFLDDDFFMASDYLEMCEAVFMNRPDVAMVTGRVVLDGITGPGLPVDAAREAVRADEQARLHAPAQDRLSPVYNGYGCNMAVRMRIVREHGLRFDEDLPLYGWLEDVDFTRRLGRHGALVLAERCRGVHLGSKRGRSPGLRLGYSQVANPIYLYRKGSIGWRRMATQMWRNVAANGAHWFRPEPWVDRRGRLRGNLLGFLDWSRGRLTPLRAKDLN